MIEQATRWGKIRVDDYVRDSAGKAWRVEADGVVEDKGYLLIDREGQRQIVKPWLGADVTQLVPTHDEALFTVEQLLGATIHAQMYPKRPTSCLRNLGTHLPDWHSHLLHMHGRYCKSGKGSRSLKYLAELHDEEHGQQNRQLAHNFSPHLHDLDRRP